LFQSIQRNGASADNNGSILGWLDMPWIRTVGRNLFGWFDATADATATATAATGRVVALVVIFCSSSNRCWFDVVDDITGAKKGRDENEIDGNMQGSIPGIPPCCKDSTWRFHRYFTVNQ